MTEPVRVVMRGPFGGYYAFVSCRAWLKPIRVSQAFPTEHVSGLTCLGRMFADQPVALCPACMQFVLLTLLQQSEKVCP